ncbi:unnamed protein product [Diamesa serratosioi]
MKYLISLNDETAENAQVAELENNNVMDNVATIHATTSQNRLRFSSKQTESDDEDEDEDESPEVRKERQKKLMDEFHEEMHKKREMRQQCIRKMREDLIDLRDKLTNEQEINEQLRETLDNSGNKTMEDLSDENKKLKAELAECQMFLQTSNSENITMSLENKALKDHVRSLKEVQSACKEMLKIREEQNDVLKAKLTEIEVQFQDKETKLMSTELQQEYHRQLENIRNMKELYEERANILAQERDEAKQKLEEKEHDLLTEIEKSKSLLDYQSVLENNVQAKSTDIGLLESEIGFIKSEKAQVQSEMNAVNQLISQVLLGFNANGNNVDIDKLVSMLEQNRDFLNDMALKEEFECIEEGAFLPKLLYDLFVQVNQPKNDEMTDEASASTPVDGLKNPCSAEEITEKLPKVWRVLLELLSHHKKLNEIQLDEDEKALNDCYKSVQTATGPQSVLSVSKTFVKLKDLILEKKSLQKDTNRLKTLYSHLEVRLDKQEKRLSNVSLELTKTWHLVGKIKRQHRQLHTHEQILCYQLHQKRKILNELKSELEYCRKKWALAREKNNESEIQCRALRQEFTLRKIQDQNSAESGYSDEHPSDADADEDDSTLPLKRMVTLGENAEKFDENLNRFDRTASPTYSERRRSESHDFSEMFLVSRAQSEPPSSSFLVENYGNLMEQLILPQQLISIHVTEAEVINDDDDNNEIIQPLPEIVKEPIIVCVDKRKILVTMPPPVLKNNNQKPGPTAELSSTTKAKKQKKKKTDDKTGKKKAESAEHMFKRLMAGMNGESYASEEEDEESDASVEELELDVVQPCSAVVQEVEVIVEDLGAVCMEMITEKLEELKEDIQPVEVPEPSTPLDDFSRLKTHEQEYLQKREARLARLELEAKEFYDRMTRNKQRSLDLNDQINNTHQTFLDRNKERAKAVEDTIIIDEVTEVTDVKEVEEMEAVEVPAIISVIEQSLIEPENELPTESNTELNPENTIKDEDVSEEETKLPEVTVEASVHELDESESSLIPENTTKNDEIS